MWLDAGADLKALTMAAILPVEDERGRMTPIDFSGSEEGIDGWQELVLVDAGLAGRISADSFVESTQEAFRLWWFRREFGKDIHDVDAYLQPIAGPFQTSPVAGNHHAGHALFTHE